MRVLTREVVSEVEERREAKKEVELLEGLELELELMLAKDPLFAAGIPTGAGKLLSEVEKEELFKCARNGEAE